MFQEVIPIAGLLFGKAGIRSFPAGTEIAPYQASILEILVHCHSADDAHKEYGRRAASISTGNCPSPGTCIGRGESWGGQTGLLLVREKAMLGPARLLPEAFRHAATHRWAGSGMVDVTAMSGTGLGVVPGVLRGNTSELGTYPGLDRAQFGDAIEALGSAGLVSPVPRSIDFGHFKRYAPFCPEYGYSRGTAIDRHYLQQFVAAIRDQVIGATVEIGGRKGNQGTYGFDRCSEYRVMDVNRGAGVDIVADAHDRAALPRESLDSVVLFNVLEHCERPRRVVENIHGWLRTAGRVFCVVPNAQRVHRCPRDFWRILPDAFPTLFEGFRIVKLVVYGNMLASIASLAGVAAEEMSARDLAEVNLEYPVATGVIAEKLEAPLSADRRGGANHN
jgi:SAM-dependent methyltransferase